MILVFGKTGQVASELITAKDITALGRDQANLSDPEFCLNVIISYKPKAVINAAAYTAVDKAEDEETLAECINAEAPAAMAKACAELNIPLVHISSDYVFDGTGTEPWRTFDHPNPQNAYGRSKLHGEQAIKASGCAYAILRTSWIFSKHGNNFVKTMLRLSETKDNITVVNDQIGGPTCARDIARTCISIAKQLIQRPNKKGVYHYSGQPDVTWCQFANTIFELAGRQTSACPISTSDYPTRASRPLNSQLNCSTTNNVFGIPRPYWHNQLANILKEFEQVHDKA